MSAVEDTPVFIIAEAGVNHNGSLAMARELVHAAAEAGADAVKFQTFDTAKLVLASAATADYQRRNMRGADNQHAMLKALELDRDAHFELRDLCRTVGIEFMSSGFDPASVAFLAEEVGVARLKIPSGEIVNGPLLLRAARTGLPLIVSTGMCTLDEVLECLSLIAWAARHPQGTPAGRAALAAVRAAADWAAPLAAGTWLLHCVTQYPAPPEATNLRAMATLGRATGLRVGLSDHSEGRHIAVAAVAAGATVLEKHFSLSRRLPGPDHVASLEPDELAAMVQEVRDVEKALGSGEKVPLDMELRNRIPARGSLVAARPIRAGEPFSLDNVTTKRPGNGVSPLLYWDVVGGQRATRDYAADEQLEPAPAAGGAGT
ncbi:MAG: N-acetylneuraminate synthase [Alphaproteobacteria bacterium]